LIYTSQQRQTSSFTVQTCYKWLCS